MLYSLKNFARAHPIISSLLAGLVIYSLYDVWQQRWVCDDAYISFRYALNLGRGHGMVYNPGERVEGYTNFFWTLVFVPGLMMGLDPRPIVYALGIICFLGLLGLVWRLEYHIKTRAGGMFFPLATAGLALHTHARIFATGGLETTCFALLNLAGAVLLIVKREKPRISLAMAFFCLSALTRPEGLLYYFVASLYLIFEYSGFHPGQRSWWIKHLQAHQALLFIFIPYFIWRYHYFGWLFPNTFYAKAMYQNQLEQGLTYLGLYFNAYYIFYFIPVAFIGMLLVLRKRYTRLGENLLQTDRDVIWLLCLPTLLYFSYYTYAGGGFMFGRFLVPFVAQLYLILAYSIRRAWPSMQARKKYYYMLFASLPLICTFFYRDPFKNLNLDQKMISGIVPEHQIYTRQIIDENINKVKPWRQTFREANIRIAITGSQAVLAYYIDAPYVLEAAQGLTDAQIAHRPLDKSRGRVGHERRVSLLDMQARKIDLFLAPRPLHEKDAMDAIIFPGYETTPQQIITFDPAKLRALRDKLGARFQFKLED